MKGGGIMKRIACLTVFLVVAVFAFPTYAGKPKEVVIVNQDPVPIVVNNGESFPREPFLVGLVNPVAQPGVGNGEEVLATVPAGKLLVLETISVTAGYFEGEDRVFPTVSVRIQEVPEVGLPQTLALFAIPLIEIPIVDPGTRRFWAIQAFRIYVPEGTEVSILTGKSGNSFAGVLTVSVSASGYFVPIDSPSLGP